MDQPQGPEELEKLVGETMAGITQEHRRQHADGLEEAAQRARRAALRRLAAVVVVPLCLVLTGLNVAGVRWLGGAAAVPSSAEARATAETLLRDAVDELRYHFELHGSYPLAPGFIGPDGIEGDDEPFSYELVGPTRYVLSVTVQGETAAYDSRQDPAVLGDGRGRR